MTSSDADARAGQRAVGVAEPRFAVMGALGCLALGAFAVGTEGLMIAGLLPKIGTDLGVPVSKAGQLVMVFALAYAISSPLLMTLTATMRRGRLLLLSMVAFAAANLLAAIAPSFGALMGARVLLACAAGVYGPAANAFGAAIAPPEKRGRALAVVNGGFTLALALGVPLSTLLGAVLSWRSTFIVVASLAALAATGLAIGVRYADAGATVAPTIRERLAVARRPDVLGALVVTLLWATGNWTLYTYVASFFARVAHIDGFALSAVLLASGVAAATGVAIGGLANDRFGGRRVRAGALGVTCVGLAGLSLGGALLEPSSAILPVLLSLVVWGVASWAFHPAQQAFLFALSGPRLAPIALSLNASALYLGCSLGALVGSLTLRATSVAQLGWVGAACVLAGLAVLVGARRVDAS